MSNLAWTESGGRVEFEVLVLLPDWPEGVMSGIDEGYHETMHLPVYYELL